MGGTLLITRKTKRHNYFIGALEAKGFRDVTATAVERNGLSLVINDVKPKMIIIDIEFFKSSSCYMIKGMVDKYEDIIFIVFSMMEFPLNWAMWLVTNGVNSYLNWLDDEKEFNYGLECIKNGVKYISPDVKEFMNSIKELSAPAENVTGREMEIWRLICCGYKEYEMADELNVSVPTITFHRRNLLNNLGVRNSGEAAKVAHCLHIFSADELNFYGGRYGVENAVGEFNRNRRLNKWS